MNVFSFSWKMKKNVSHKKKKNLFSHMNEFQLFDQSSIIIFFPHEKNTFPSFHFSHSHMKNTFCPETNCFTQFHTCKQIFLLLSITFLFTRFQTCLHKFYPKTFFHCFSRDIFPSWFFFSSLKFLTSDLQAFQVPSPKVNKNTA